MQRVHHRRLQVDQEEDFQAESLPFLVKPAKQKAFERINSDISVENSANLPFHDFTERLLGSLQQMHHYLQSLLLQKLGPDACNVIAAERVRLDHAQKERLEANLRKNKGQGQDATYIPKHLNGLGQSSKDGLELLNEYHERYAAILAEVLAMKDRLIEIEKALESRTRGGFHRRSSEEIAELSRGRDEDEEDFGGNTEIDCFG
jgi:hypothetical protein